MAPAPSSSPAGAAAPSVPAPSGPGRTEASEAAAAPLVFLRDKSGGRHAPGCIKGGAAFVWADPSRPPSPMRSKASNRCEGCARAVAFENATMLRMDAEENDAPDFVLTLTSRRVDFTSREYSAACAVFWRAFRRRYGSSVEACGFIEWTTGEGPRSGGLRRLHSHWMVKSRGADLSDTKEVQAWASAEWAKLTGAWRVDFAHLRTVGGVVGYLALHHEKMEQAPPPGWTGRRLRPSKGYFAEPGHVRRARARLWLQERLHGGVDEWGIERVMPPAEGRVLWRGRPFTEVEGVAGSTVLDAPGRSFDSLPARRELDRRLLSSEAPIHADPLDAAEADHAEYLRRYRYRERMRAMERRRGTAEPGGIMGS